MPEVSKIFLVVFLVLFFSGCYSLKEVTIEDDEEIRIYRIETMDGKILDFHDSKLGFALLIKDRVVVTKINGEQKVFPKSDIKKYYTIKLIKFF